MENASKALIIAGAILLSILIIALGVFVFNQAKSAVGNTGLSDQEVAAFNSKFESYEGKQKGSSVKALINAVKNITGQTIIPVYEGAKDFIVLSKGKRMTAAVLYPITSKQRKYLNKIGSSRNTFINHLLWIQKNKLKPERLREPGSRLYDIQENRIFENIDNEQVRNQLLKDR